MSRLRNDSGQGMLPLMVLVACGILVVTFSLIVPWGSATTDKTQTQTAADAGALAAAQRTRELWDVATRPGVLTFVGGPVAANAVRGLGCTSSHRFAASNDARVTSCQAHGSSRIRVQVRSTADKGTDNPPAEAEASVEMDIDFDGCRWTELPPPPSVLTTTFTSTLDCGSWEAEYLLTNVPPYPVLSLTTGTREQLFNGLEPRLVD